MLYRLFFLSIIVFFSSCTNNRQKRKELVSEKIDFINNNNAYWQKLTQDILADPYVNQNLGKFIVPYDLDKTLNERLTQQGIIRLSVQKNENCIEVEYATDWARYPIGALFLTWTTCNSVQTTKGYYLDNFNFNFIEVWGAGNNWLIYVDSDFI